ncbi:VWA domain-containing protein [Paracoccus tibetensis]|uniref:Ca-activated chloride channel family protein n=1 Tax=Paracoccus tibetensis TaxID=336292 RepID=A0A1G5K4U1_9RHOB|nr:VWA domain-containing protein [Paracoccus tibetensis]SCY95556.1 Ca-activated chloride channel family protein [Paracoccus tibetensis]
MSLAAPYLLALLPLPLLLRWLCPAADQDRVALQVPEHLFPPDTAQAQAWHKGFPLTLAAAWLLLVVALSGPQVERMASAVPASGRDIILTLDLSGSMEKEDFLLDDQPVSRLEAVKRTAASFVASRTGDRIGLVIFGARAYVAAPPSFDVASVAQAIEEAQIGISGRGTAISDGLGLATRRLLTSEAPSRVIILLSDGVDTSGSVPAADAARLAASHGIRIYTIALGPEDLETQPASRDAVDVATLRAIAEAADGQMFRVRTTPDLDAVAEALDRLEPNPADRPPLRYWQPLWFWPGAGAALLLVLALLRGRAWRT